MLRVLRQAVGDNASPYRHQAITGGRFQIAFSSYLTRKSHISTLTALRKALGDLGGLGGRAHDGLSSLPVEEK